MLVNVGIWFTIVSGLGMSLVCEWRPSYWRTLWVPVLSTGKLTHPLQSCHVRCIRRHKRDATIYVSLTAASPPWFSGRMRTSSHNKDLKKVTCDFPGRHLAARERAWKLCTKSYQLANPKLWYLLCLQSWVAQRLKSVAVFTNKTTREGAFTMDFLWLVSVSHYPKNKRWLI